MNPYKALRSKLRRNKKLYKLLGPIYGIRRNAVIQSARLLHGIDRNLVVFSAFEHRSYNDNPRYISEKLHELRPETDIVWLFADAAAAKAKYDIPPYVRCLNVLSAEGYRAFGRARVLVDNFNKRTYLKIKYPDQVYIQTWHADRAFKKVGYDMNVPRARMLEENCTLGITGSDYGDMQFRSAFHYKGELLRVGSPRNDILIRNDPDEAAAIRKKLNIAAETGLLLYAPTYRDVDSRGHQAQRAPLDLPHLLDVLEKRDGRPWKCLVRAHYMSYGIALNMNSDRMIPVTAYPEMAELMLIADALITDYSSCAGDFALTRRPIFLYQDDLQDYAENNRALYFDMKDSPYWVADTPEKMDALIEGCTPERAKENCDAILRFYGENETGHASEKVAEYIIDKLS